MAAVAVHALLLTVPTVTTIATQTPQQPLKIHLLMQAISTAIPPKVIPQQSPSQPIKKKPPVQVVKRQPIHQPTPIITAHKKAAVAVPVQHQPALTVSPKVQPAIPITAPQLPTPTPSSGNSKKNAQTVTDATRINISAQVHYPKRARRQGWGGRVECGFNVHNHRLQNIVIITSSGHAILDRAAKRGLQMMGDIDLVDGDYRMPVVFDLTP